MLSDFFLLSLKNIKHRGIRSWLTVLGILIGVASVVALISLGNGLKLAINSQFGIGSTEIISIQAGGVNAFGPPGSGAVVPLTIEDIKIVENVAGVDNVIRRNIPPGKLEFNDRVIFGFSANIPDGEDRELLYELLDIEMEEGRLLKDGDQKYAVLGNNFLTNKVGLDKPVHVGDNVLIQDVEFEVIGITKKEGSFIFDNIVYINDEPLKEISKFGDNVDVIAVKIKKGADINEVAENIEKALRKSRGVKVGEEDFEVSTPQSSLETVNSIITGVQIFISIIALISIIIGAIGIVNTMTTSVLERRKEIGAMKAIGARNSHIFLIFLLESGLMGFFGSVIGIIIGLTIGYLGTLGIGSWLGASIMPEFDILLISFTLLGGFIIGSIAGISPAMKAANQSPIEALRS